LARTAIRPPDENVVLGTGGRSSRAAQRGRRSGRSVEALWGTGSVRTPCPLAMSDGLAHRGRSVGIAWGRGPDRTGGTSARRLRRTHRRGGPWTRPLTRGSTAIRAAKDAMPSKLLLGQAPWTGGGGAPSHQVTTGPGDPPNLSTCPAVFDRARSARHGPSTTPAWCPATRSFTQISRFRFAAWRRWSASPQAGTPEAVGTRRRRPKRVQGRRTCVVAEAHSAYLRGTPGGRGSRRSNLNPVFTFGLHTTAGTDDTWR